MKPQRQIDPVLPDSKKIKKSVGSSPESSKKKKKYSTFDANARKAILSSLKSAIIAMELADPKDNDFSPGDFKQILENMGLNDLNNILSEVLKPHVRSFRSDVQSLRQWRRKIKEWIVSSEKPEMRGNGLIPHEKLGQFKEHLVPEIKKMSTRNFVTVKQTVMEVFKKIDEPGPAKSCSKHWWYSFLDRNPDIKEIWDVLPKRGNPRKNNKNPSDSDGESDTGSAIEEEGLDMDIDFIIEPVEVKNPGPIESVKEEEKKTVEKDMGERKFSTFSNFAPVVPVFEAETKLEKLMSWRDAHASLEQEDSLILKCLESENVKKIYRSHSERKRQGINELVEQALGLETQGAGEKASVDLFKTESLHF